MLARAQAAQEIADLAGTTVEAVGFLDGVGSHPWVGARHVLAEHRRDGSQDDPRRIASIVHLEPWTRGVGKPLQMDRGPAVRVGGGDGLLFAQAAVESDRKDPRRVVVDRAAHSDDAVDMRPQRLGDRLGEARAQDDELDRGSGSLERLGDRIAPDESRLTVRVVEVQPVWFVVRRGGCADVPPGCQARRPRDGRRTMAAEMDHGRLALTQLTQQIERLRCPSSDEVEPIAIAAALQLGMDRAHLAIEQQRRGPGWARRQEQDHMLLRPRSGLR